MPRIVNRAKMTTATTGTGTITLGSAVSGYQSFAAGGVLDGDVVPYVIEESNSWEIGFGTYTASGTTMARTTIVASSNSNAAISLAGSATVSISPIAESVTPSYNGLSSSYIAPIVSAAANAVNVSNVTNVLVVAPLAIPYRVTITRIGMRTGASHTTSTTARLGLYYNRPTTDLPGKILLDAGTVSTAASNTNYEVTFSAITLLPGLYWTAYVATGGSLQMSCFNTATSYCGPFGYNSSLVFNSRVQRSFTYGTLPTDETSQTYTLDNVTFNPCVWVRP